MIGFKKLRIAGPAKADLAQIAEYTRRQWGIDQKRKYLNLIRDKFKALQQTPHLGAPRDDISKGLRALPVAKHLIFYRDSETELAIIRVLHESMDVERLKDD